MGTSLIRNTSHRNQTFLKGTRFSRRAALDDRSWVVQFKNNYFPEKCSGSEAGSYLRLIDFVYHSTLRLRVIKKKKKVITSPPSFGKCRCSPHVLFTEMCSGSEAGSYLRRIDFCITQLYA